MPGLRDDLKQHGPLGYGAMGVVAFYGKPLADDEADKVLQHVIDQGCTHIDSADVYGPESSENLIARVVKAKNQREKIFVATKFGAFEWDHAKAGQGPASITGPGNAKPETLRSHLAGSIKRLGFTPDLYYLHRPDPDTPIEVTMEEVEKQRKAGQFKYFGISEMSADTLRRACKAGKVDAIQVEFSPWTLDIEKNGIAAVAKEYDVVVVAYSPLGRGFMSGKLRSPDDFEEGDFRKSNPRFQGQNFHNNLKIVDQLQKIADKKGKGITSGQICLAWIISRGYVPIPGSTKLPNIDENVAAGKIQLTPQEIEEIDELVKNAEIAGARYDKAGMARIGH